MANAIYLQAAMTLIVVVIAAIVGGANAAVSAGIGGLACLVPSGLFAMRLAWESRRPGGATMQGFFVGEFAKLALTVAMLCIAARVYRELNWPALVIGLIAVLKSYFLMFLFGSARR